VEVSIVIPAKNEEDNVEPLISEIMTALDGVVEFEIVYVDDGSTDNTHAKLLRLMTAGNTHITPIRHRYSVGQSTAIMTGIQIARGELVVTLDADGQNDPEVNLCFNTPAVFSTLVTTSISERS
jgi:glycosyltransferase involved in cell wall biosynthesis